MIRECFSKMSKSYAWSPQILRDVWEKSYQNNTNPIVDIRFENPVLRIHINQTRRDYGISMYIRRGRSEPFTTDFLLEAGNFNREVLNVLQAAAKRLIGCVFLGGVGSGKTVHARKIYRLVT